MVDGRQGDGGQKCEMTVEDAVVPISNWGYAGVVGLVGIRLPGIVSDCPERLWPSAHNAAHGHVLQL